MAEELIKNIKSMSPDAFTQYWDESVRDMMLVCLRLIDLENNLEKMDNILNEIKD